MDASALITILFIAMILTISIGFWYYSKKAHSIVSSTTKHVDLLADIQQSVKEYKRSKEG